MLTKPKLIAPFHSGRMSKNRPFCVPCRVGGKPTCYCLICQNMGCLLMGKTLSGRSTGKDLAAYKAKRDFSRTREPSAGAAARKPAEKERLFVIQKHAARNLHYDFRLEMEGVLRSWAVPKGPPYELNEKRLAMETEDHPIEYMEFEGTIPKGQYGGGTVMVWDIGTYELIDGNYDKRKLHVLLAGKKLKGEWLLTRTGDPAGRKWLLIKTGSSARPISAKRDNQSALTGRTME